jgi:hypothetical protein
MPKASSSASVANAWLAARIIETAFATSASNFFAMSFMRGSLPRRRNEQKSWVNGYLQRFFSIPKRENYNLDEHRQK